MIGRPAGNIVVGLKVTAESVRAGTFGELERENSRFSELAVLIQYRRVTHAQAQTQTDTRQRHIALARRRAVTVAFHNKRFVASYGIRDSFTPDALCAFAAPCGTARRRAVPQRNTTHPM